MPEQREVAVVGAGLLGLAAARALAVRGHDVVVFEQAGIGHARGGSHGTARVFRLGYPDPEYVALAQRARRLWTELESATGRTLLVPAGQLSFGDGVDRLAGALREAGAPAELLPAAEVAARFPSISTGGACLYEPESCVIMADRALAALASAVPDLRAAQPVHRVAFGPGEDGVSLDAGGARVTARAAVICAGPWTGGLLAGTPVTVPATATLEQVAYVVPAGERGPGGQAGERGPGEQAGERGPGERGQGGQTGPGYGGTRPIFIRYSDRSPYGVPVPGCDRYKVGVHPSGPPGGRGRAGPVVPPSWQDAEEDPALRAELIDMVRRYLPGFRPDPVASERCVYDNTADEDFVVDRAGPLVVGCGTSGHGFKFGPLLGEWLADLATGREPAGLPSRFSLGRFRR